MGAERDRISVRVHLLVVEVVVSLRIGPKLGIVLVGRQHERGAAAPAAHQLCGDQFLLLRGVAVLPKKLAKLPHMLREPPVGHVAAVARQNFRPRTVGYDSVFVRVAKNELTRLQRIAGAGRGLLARPLDDRLRQTVPITKMIVSMIKRRNGVKVERREDLDAGTIGDKLRVLRDAAVMFRFVPCEEDDNGMQIGARKPADPMFGGVHADVAEHLRTRDHPLLELLRK